MLNFINKIRSKPRTLWFYKDFIKKRVNAFCFAHHIKFQIPILEHIILYLNNVCNAHCLMCDIGQDSNKGIDRLKNSKNRHIETDLIKKILSDPYLADRKISFNLLMTEPLLHPQVEEIVYLIKKKGHAINLTTNGYLLPKKATKLSEAGLDSIQVSLDGPPLLNDKIRRISSYENAINGIKLLRTINKKIMIIINYTIVNLNYNALNEFVELIEANQINIDLVKFQFMDFVSTKMINKQKSTNIQIIQSESTMNEIISPDKVDTSKLADELKKVKNFKSKYIKNIQIIPNISTEKDLNLYFNNEGVLLNNFDYCILPFHQIAIKTDGNALYHMRCFDYCIGNITKDSLSAVFNSRSSKFFRQALKDNSYCLPACTRCCGVMHK